MLGEGSYGSVYKALHKLTGELYAVKIVSIVGEAESLKREISILKDCKSTFIVRFLKSLQDITVHLRRTITYGLLWSTVLREAS